MDGCSPSHVLARPLARPSSTLRARLLALVAEAAEQEPSTPEPSPRAASRAAADLLRLVRGARAPPGAATPVGPPHCARLLPPSRLPRAGAHARAPSPPVAPRRSNTSRTPATSCDRIRVLHLPVPLLLISPSSSLCFVSPVSLSEPTLVFFNRISPAQATARAPAQIERARRPRALTAASQGSAGLPDLLHRPAHEAW